MPETLEQRNHDAGTQRTPTVRERILAAADEYFYQEGIRAVSADRLIAAAGVSKVTFYRHFPSKDDLIVAYVEGRAAVERDGVAALRAQAGDAGATLVAIAHVIGETSCAPGFRGCPFINAAAEFADSTHPVRRLIAAHRTWFAEFLDELLTELGVEERGPVVEQLVMLRDGAMVGGYLGADPTARVDALVSAGRAVLARARTARTISHASPTP